MSSGLQSGPHTVVKIDRWRGSTNIISSSGIQPDPTKIFSITNFPIPRNLKGLRAFLGLTGYYRRFSPLYAKNTQPLLELTKKGQKWKWEKKHQDAFNQVKTLFMENIMLHHPQREGKFVIYSDASDYAVGTVPVSYTHLDVYKRQV